MFLDDLCILGFLRFTAGVHVFLKGALGLFLRKDSGPENQCFWTTHAFSGFDRSERSCIFPKGSGRLILRKGSGIENQCFLTTMHFGIFYGSGRRCIFPKGSIRRMFKEGLRN